MVTDMTLNDISCKLIKNNLKQYSLFFFSVLFSITMTGAYGVLQYSPTVTNVLVDGGSTQTISQAMFLGSMLGIIVFLIYEKKGIVKYPIPSNDHADSFVGKVKAPCTKI